jgi:uncharacterized protein (TIGR03382 family)
MTLPLPVMFRPIAAGAAMGTVTIASDGGTVVIPLTGEGLDVSVPPGGGCCSSSSNPSSVWLGLGVLGLIFMPRRRRWPRRR